MRWIAMMLRRLTALILSAAVFLAASGASAEIIDQIVARVNDEIVTLHDVRQAAIPYMLQKGMNPNSISDPADKRELYEEVLQDLIDRRLIVTKANEIDLEISDEELEQWLAFTRQQQGMEEEQFKKVIEGYGMEYATYTEMVRENLLRARLVRTRVGSSVMVSEDEVDAEYKRRYGSLNAEETVVTVSHILMRPSANDAEALEAARKRALEAKRRIDAGEEFADVARELSEGPTAPKGGELGTFGPGELAPEFEEHAFTLEVGKPSDVVRTKFGYHIILVSDRQTRVSNSVQQRRDQIHAELQQKAMARQLEEFTSQLRNRAFVEVNY